MPGEFPEIFFNPDISILICQFFDWPELGELCKDPETRKIVLKIATAAFIHEAIQNKNTGLSYSLFGLCSEIFYVENARGEMPVYHVAKYNHTDIRWMFLASRPNFDIYRVNSNGLTQYELAFANGDDELVQRFEQDFGVDINHRSSSGFLPIENAIKKRDLDLVLKMRDRGAKLDSIILDLIEAARFELALFSEVCQFKLNDHKSAWYSSLDELEKNFEHALKNLKLISEQLEMTYFEAVSTYIPDPNFSFLPGVILAMFSGVINEYSTVPLWSIGGTSSLAILFVLSGFICTATSMYKGPLDFVTELRKDKNAELLQEFKKHLPEREKICVKWINLLRDLKSTFKRCEKSKCSTPPIARNPFSFVRKLMFQNKSIPDAGLVLPRARIASN